MNIMAELAIIFGICLVSEGISALLPFLCAAILTTPLVYAATAWSIQLMLRARRRKESHHA